MPKRSSTAASHEGPALRHSPAEHNQREKNPAAVALGRLGGLKGGKARAEALSEDERREIARKAAEARWSRQPKGK